MFSKGNEHTSSRVDTILGKNFRYKGILEANDGSLRIDGYFEGELRIGGDLFVGESGIVSGMIIAKNVTIAGQVNGKIEANGKLALTPAAKVLADAKMVSLAIEEGAFYKGVCEPKSNEDPQKHGNDIMSENNENVREKIV
jgi:cytoskeletal protein CcmA (bactofilin family)